MNWKRVLRIERPLDRQAVEDVETEFRFHIDARTGELVAQGCSPRDARARAEREFGDVRVAQAALVPPARRAERRRRAGRWTDEILRDARESIRSLRANPAFTFVAIATLAISIGANTGIFSVANAVMFRPLPYHEPGQIVALHETEAGVTDRNAISTATVIDWRNENTSFSDFGPHGFISALASVDNEGRPRRVQSTTMSPGAFRILGVSPVLGRLFTPEEGESGAPPLAVLSWNFWQSVYGGDESVIGRNIALDGIDHAIVGVMGPRFRFPNGDIEVWRSMRLAAASDGQNRRAHQWRAIARLAPGVSVARADADLDAISARLEPLFPQEMTGWGARVVPLQADMTGSVRPLMWVLLGVVIAVLLVACANLANLMLARFAARAREMAVRSALGAGRGRLVRRGVVETFVLGVVGGTLGVVLGLGLMRLFLAIAPADIPLLEDTALDPTVLLFAICATLGSTLLFGLVPALQTSRVDPSTALNEGRRGSTGGRAQGRLRSGILISQVALSSLLLIGAGLLVRSMIELQRVDYGYEPGGLLAVSLNLPANDYPGLAEQNGFYESLLDRIGTIPGVTAVSSTTEPPVVGFEMTFGYVVEGKPRSGPDPFYDAVHLRVVTPDYFETMRQPLASGRALGTTDREGAPTAVVVNEVLANLRWPGENPIGERISFEGPDGPWAEVVGVAEATRHTRADEQVPAVFMPFAQKEWNWMGWQTLMIRTDISAAALIDPIQEAIWSLDRALPIERFERVEDLYAESRARNRFAMQLLVAFAGIALVLGAIGLYGVLAYSVGQRRQEIGVRMALGAAKPSIANMVLRDGLKLCFFGLGIGVTLAVLGTRFLASLLYGVGSRDPLTFALIPVLLLAVGAAASWLPARRAAETDPATVLRDG